MPANSTRRRRKQKADANGKLTKPEKPYDAFPLTPHASGAWQKKIRGKVHYFGRWAKTVNGKMERLPGDGAEEALELYKTEADDLHAGRTPSRVQEDELTIRDICNRYRTHKQNRVDSGEITERTMRDYVKTCDRLVEFFGKDRPISALTAQDFEALRAHIAKSCGPVRLGNEIVRCRSVFKYNRLSDLLPDEFKPPRKNVMQKHYAKRKAQQGELAYTREELQRLLKAASVPMKAMILLGVNCAYGNNDIAQLPLSALDLEGGWATFPRVKNGNPRRAKLWPETVAALKAVLAARPAPLSRDDQDAVFITTFGNRWCDGKTDSVGLQFGKLLRKLKLKRPGRAFYALRKTFRTEADASQDFPAVRLVMGHCDEHAMDSVYRQRIDDSRLEAVANHVHRWLFAKPKRSKRKGGAK